jgi:tRNA-specific 2-thiouridylase
MAKQKDAALMLPGSTRGAIVVAMSGGVDSSVAAALLRREGHDVIGVTLRLWSEEPGARDGHDGGQSCTAIADAQAVAERLGIPHVVLDCGAAFDRHVAQYFAAAYQRGETPNPCVPCNTWLKFGELLRAARDWGAAGLATGHYARVAYHEATGRHRLYRASDRRKDQSYFLYALDQDQLAFARFPLGDLAKAETRRLAREFGLPVADKADSQQACFAAGDYRAYLRDRLGTAIAPGVMRDAGGAVCGRHGGLPLYTVGQRHGLGLGNARPRYVVALDPSTNEVVVGEDCDLWTREAEMDGVNLIAVHRLSTSIRVRAKIRYAHEPQAAAVTPLPADRLRLTFDEPQRAVAPGQAAVLYDDDAPDVVVGGGTICRTDRATEASGDRAGSTRSHHE